MDGEFPGSLVELSGVDVLVNNVRVHSREFLDLTQNLATGIGTGQAVALHDGRHPLNKLESSSVMASICSSPNGIPMCLSRMSLIWVSRGAIAGYTFAQYTFSFSGSWTCPSMRTLVSQISQSLKSSGRCLRSSSSRRSIRVYPLPRSRGHRAPTATGPGYNPSPPAHYGTGVQTRPSRTKLEWCFSREAASNPYRDSQPGRKLSQTRGGRATIGRDRPTGTR